MVACLVGFTGDELVVDNVFKERAAVEQFEVRAFLTQLLENFPNDDVTSFLVQSLVKLLPDCW